MSHLDVNELLAPMADDEPAASDRHHAVDRNKIIDRMVEVSAEATRPWTRWVAALAVAAGVALAVWGGGQWLRGTDALEAATPGLEIVALRGRVTAPAADGSFETSADTEARIRVDGLELDLASDTRVSVRELGGGKGNSTLRLERGRVLCKIAHRPARTFSVVTDDVRVVDVGTIFSVSVAPSVPGTDVRVDEGEVMVHHAGNTTRVTAQQSFSSKTPVATSVAPEPAGQVDAEQRPEPGSSSRAASKRPRETLGTETELLRSGLAAEQQGDLRGAKQAFEKLVTRYPASPLVRDARAALARVKGRLESDR